MFFLLLLLHFHWRFYTVSQRIICSVELIHGCPVDSNILSGLFISGHKPMKNILEGVIKKKMHHLFNISTFFHLQKLKIKSVTLSVEFSSGPNRRCRYSIGSDTSIRNGSKKKIQNMKRSRRDEKFNSEKLSQTDPILKDCPENEWDILMAEMCWEPCWTLIMNKRKRSIWYAEWRKHSKVKTFHTKKTLQLQICACIFYLFEFLWVFFFSFPPSWANLQKGGCGLDRVLSSA